MAARDPYSVIGVAKSADEAEIKSAFRKKAKKLHPDANPGDDQAQARFAELNSAYEILGDKDKRRQFDTGEIDAEGKPRFTGFEGFGGGPTGRGGRAGQAGFGQHPGGFAFQWKGRGPQGGADVFDDIFGGLHSGSTFGTGPDPRASAGRAPQPSTPERVTAEVSIDALIADHKLQIPLSGGRLVNVMLPKGTRDGSEVRLKGQGKADPATGQPRDVIVSIRFKPHEHFTVDHDDLRTILPVPLETMVLGGKLRVPTLTGQVQMTIQKGTDPTKTLRLKGKGLPRKSSGHGDLLVTLQAQWTEDQLDDLETLVIGWQAENTGADV